VDRSPIYTTKINDSYLAFTEHYNTAIVPARVRKPQDKAVVEGSVGICEKWVIAALRNQTFFSLAELNEAVSEKVAWINERPFKEKDGCRQSLFFDEEKGELKDLPSARYEHFSMKKLKVGHDYHVQVDYMRYSVDYHFIKQTVDIRITDHTVKIYHAGTLIAEHERVWGRKGQYVTRTEHMPPNHQHYDSSWSPERFMKWAANIGPYTTTVIETFLKSRPIVEQAFVPAANILGLSKKGRSWLLERACAKIVSDNTVDAVSYTRVKNLMEAIKKADEVMEDTPTSDVDIDDGSLGIGRTRGADYYRRDKE
jgi:hypothetical protein